jgi:hypothetical protein
MKKLLIAIAFLPLVSLMASDITGEIPVINYSAVQGFQKVPNVAQYKEADWSHVVGIAYGITLDEAQQIAQEDSEITFFFHTKGYQMVLEKTDGTYRVFHEGDTVFFKGSPWWGSAPGLADGYVRTL